MKNLILFTLLLILVSCSSINTSKLASSSKSTDGFYYALPKRHIIVEFEIKKTVLKKGKYAQYAKDCLGLETDEIYNNEPKTTFTIGDVIVKSKTYLDKSRIFQLKINQAFVNKTDFSLDYDKNGELKSASQTIENQIIPFTTSLVNTISSLSISSLVLSEDNNPIPSQCTDPFVKNDVELLSTLQSKTFAILEAETEISKEQLEQRLAKIEEIKSSILSKFTGTKKITTKKISFEIDPSNAKDSIQYGKVIELFKLDKTLGLKQLYNVAVDTKIAFSTSKTLAKDSKVITLKLKNTDGVTAEITGKIGTQKEGSFYYCIPANTEIIIKNNKSIINTTSMQIPQLGVTVAGPTNLRKFKFTLHSGLGSIQSLSAKSDSISTSDIDSLRKSLLKNKDDKTIEKLEKELKIKELKDKIEKVGAEAAEGADDEG